MSSNSDASVTVYDYSGKVFEKYFKGVQIV